MKMNKYFIGQEVCYFDYGVVKNGTVAHISLHDNDIIYQLEMVNGFFNESEIYPSKNELIDNLIAKKQHEIEDLKNSKDNDEEYQ